MRKVLFILEPVDNLPDRLLYFINKQRMRHEIILSVAPRMRTECRKGSRVIVFCPDEGISRFVKKCVAKPLDVRNGVGISQKEIDGAIMNCIKITDSFLDSKKVRSMLNIEGMDYSDALRHYLMSEIFFVLNPILALDKVMKEAAPDLVYVQNENYYLGHIACLIARSNGIKCVSLEPKGYGSIKSSIRNRLAIRRYFFGEVCSKKLDIYESGSGEKKVLFYCRYINYLTAMAPVIRRLHGMGYKIYVMSNDADIKSVGLDFKKTGRLKFRDDRNGKFNRDVVKSFNGLFEYKNVNFWEIIRDKIENSVSRGLVEMVNDGNYLTGVYKTLSPDMVVVGDDRVIGGRIAVLAAKKAGIRTLEIQHGLFFKNSMPYNKASVDKIAVGGYLSGDVLLFYGTDKGKIAVTGWPKYDNFACNDITPKRNTVIFTTQPGNIPDNRETILNLSKMAYRAGFKLAVKPHPAEKSGTYKNIAGNAVVAEPNSDTRKLIENSSILVTVSSTTGIEAAIMGKPVIAVNLRGEENIGRLLASYKVAWEAKNFEELESIIRKIFSGRYRIQKSCRNRFIRDFVFKLDGKATERVVDLIEDMTKR